MMNKETEKYRDYLSLSSKEKKKRIEYAVQHEKDQRPNPQGTDVYPEENFIYFCSRKKFIKLHTYRYQLTNDPIGLVFILNGLCYHANHSAHVARYLAYRKFIVVSYDYRGFGKSEGERGEIDSFYALTFDTMDFIDKTYKLYPNLKKFLLGSSLGGLIAYHVAMTGFWHISGVILVSAMIKPMVGSFLCSIAASISRLLPKMKCYVPVKGLATKNKMVTDDLIKDPLFFSGEIPANTYKVILNSLNECSKSFGSFNRPVLIIQGGLDKVVNPEGAFYLFDKCKSPDKQILFYENMWHDAVHEIELEDFLPKIGECLGRWSQAYYNTI